MALDPIVSLAISIAESAGSCAFLLGSGVSRDAGVLTGVEVYWRAVEDLYKAELKTADVPNQDELGVWLASGGRDALGYSGILELIAPDAATRRAYVANLWEGKAPGETHHSLAEMAVRGYVRVFINTNFDPLLENALRARGINPVVVSSDGELENATRREHASCFILKPHGDGHQMTIRNTPAELAELEPAITRELQQIVDRYGLVVIGYSGSDEALGDIVRQRRPSPYGVWWVCRDEPAIAAAALIGATGSRVIRRDAAAEFVTDLTQRVEILESHSTGLTPAVVHDEVIALLRSGDSVGLDDLLLRERAAFDAGIESVTALPRVGDTTALKQALRDALLPIAERRLASLLPLAMHDPSRLSAELQALMDAISRRPRDSGNTAYLQAPQWVAWWCCHVIGAIALRERKWGAVQPSLQASFQNTFDQEQFAIARSGDTGTTLGSLAPKPDGGGNWLAPDWEFGVSALAGLAWMQERYPAFVRSDWMPGARGEPDVSLAEFSLLASIAMGLRSVRTKAYWDMHTEQARRFLIRLHNDTAFRREIAQSLGMDVDSPDQDFGTQVLAALEYALSVQEHPTFLNLRGLILTGRD